MGKTFLRKGNLLAAYLTLRAQRPWQVIVLADPDPAKVEHCFPPSPGAAPAAGARVEVIDQTGRAFAKHGYSVVNIVRQDEGRTLKVFCD